MSASPFLPSAILHKRIRNSVGKLMPLSEDGPFLRETGRNIFFVACEKTREIEDVLHHAWLLIVGLFDKEGVILDAFRKRFRGESGSGKWPACAPVYAYRYDSASQD
jgi:hypothetical protein